MRKISFLLVSFIILSSLILSDVVGAKEKVDKGPLTKRVFIHYKKPKGKPDNPGKNPKAPAGDEGSYTYIAKGMKWKTTEDYYIKTIGAPNGASQAIEDGMFTWDSQVDFPIFGSLWTDDNAGVNLDATDDKNVIEFEPLYDNQVIAVTYVWGYYNAPPRFREIVEVDMIFNTDGWLTWGDADSDGNVMDILNIATHELGHATGMGDLYDSNATEETMYGYSSPGETKKRDLYIGDKAGITNLYK